MTFNGMFNFENFKIQLKFKLKIFKRIISNIVIMNIIHSKNIAQCPKGPL